MLIYSFACLQMLGEDFSSADYWRHRDEKNPCDPKFFEVSAGEDATVDVGVATH
jgi:hypothetical protein